MNHERLLRKCIKNTNQENKIKYMKNHSEKRIASKGTQIVLMCHSESVAIIEEYIFAFFVVVVGFNVVNILLCNFVSV